MDVQATARYLPISPQKVRLVCDQVRGLDPYHASSLLKHMPQKGAGLVLKVLESAMANAENNFELDPAEMSPRSTPTKDRVGAGAALARVAGLSRSSGAPLM
jgi:large subunit ribosomal protein L22